MKKLAMALLVAGICAAPNAYGRDTDSGPYAGINLGYTYIDGNAQEIANSAVAALGGSATVTQDTSTGGGRVFAGYNVNQNVAVEVGFLKTADLTTKITGRTGGGLAYTGQADVSIESFDYAILIKPFADGGLYGKVGGHTDDSTVEGKYSIAGLSAAEKISYSGTGLMVGVGYQESLSDTIDYRIDYTYYDRVSGVKDANASAVTLGLVATF